MKDKLLIVGTGDYAEVAFFFLEKTGMYEIVGFSEERAYRKLPDLCNLPIYDLEDIGTKFPKEVCKILVAIGPNRVNTVRERIFNELRALGYSFITYVHESAFVWDVSALGVNTFIFPHVIVEPFATVGNNCVMWSGSVLAHHATLEDHCFLAPGVNISGRTRVKNNCFLGINSTVRDNIVIGEKCIIGAGSVIKKSTQPFGVYSSTGTPKYNDKSLDTKV